MNSTLLALSFAALAGALPAQSTGITLSTLVDGYLEVPYSPEVVPQGGITVEAWITYDSTTIPTGWRFPTVVRQNGNAGQEAYFLRVEAGNTNRTAIRWLVHANTTVIVDWTFPVGRLLNWTHLAGTWDGSTSRLFVDGVEVGSSTGSGPLVDMGNTLRIGKGSDVATPIEVWNGSIDEVRIWPFARTAAEITATKDQELLGLPGDVSTWNLEGHTLDTSSGRHATLTGGVTYAPGASLTSHAFPGLNVGASTPGCKGPIHAGVTALPQVGNAGFALIAHPGAAGAPTICALSASVAGTPFPLLGVDLWLDVGALFGGYATVVDALGTARLDAPIPGALLPGGQLAAQFVSVDPCGPQGLTASDVVGFAIVR